MLKLSGNRRIRHVKVKNPILNPEEEVRQKFVILDILATDRKGRVRRTMQLLADRIVELGAAESVSDDTVRRILRKTT